MGPGDYDGTLMGLHFIQPSRKRMKLSKSVLDAVKGGDMHEYIDALSEHLDEAISKDLGNGKFRYKKKVGVWRTTRANDKIFVPDDGSPPMAMAPTKKAVAAQALAKPAKKKRGKGKAKKPSVDATISFEHEGKKVTVKMKRSVWTGGDEMDYVWTTSDGKEIKTKGVPRDFDVVSDPGKKKRR